MQDIVRFLFGISGVRVLLLVTVGGLAVYMWLC
jgi:hypothetical protein